MSLQCGIIANGKRDVYPLVTATCKVSVVDVNVHAKLRQTYVSTSSEAEEVVYVFPLPADAAVCAFSAVIDATRTIEGEVKERHQAKRDYDEAVSAGKTAALLEQHSTQVFQVSLGNLKPGQTIVVDIEFVSLIAHAGIFDSLRLKLPVTVAPFYGTAPSTLPSIPRVAGKIPFELEVSFQMSGNITAITSDTHPVSVRVGSLSSEGTTAAFDATLAHVSLLSHTFLDADIVLEVKCAGLDAPRCTVQRLSIPDSDDVTDALSLTLVPRFAAVPVPKQEYIFLVDRSGSMDGGRIAAVRNALQIMLRSLPSKNSTFNVFSFGQRCDSLWPEAVAYNKDSVEQASTYVESMSANYDGTEIARALTTVFKSRERTLKEPAAVFLLTDGESWNVKNVFKTVADAVAASDKALRVFVLGVGDQVSTEMCDGIARAGRGVVTYVREREKPDAKLVGLVKAARSALVQDVSVDWGVPAEFADDFEVVDSPSVPTADAPPAAIAPVSLFDPGAKALPEELGPRDEQVSLPPFPRLQQAPMHADALPPLYPGFRCNVFALIRQPRDAPLPQRVAIRGMLLGSPAVLEVPVVAASTLDWGDTGAKAPFVHVLAARALVQDIEDLTASTGAPPSGFAKAKIARLGTTYGIATSQTSFVAIDEFGDPEPLQERYK
ncbi:hypothetical protein EXIGLDRAFT_188399 [Exidia glandulosa HHB12029]|uniref:VIT-domain-containing protein n=1 Tax=Exidia glandulosa HHB12029 TaxID=1314781 RepID=A0A165MYN4_EXIGL|nr:hypothetical protein EXIGLDRAFT_188399 [Exidia glandulosa HHB12029]